MSKQYGIALIGAGDRGGTYAKAWKQLGKARFVSVCDLQTDRVERFKNEYGFEFGTADYREAIMKKEVDIVIVCTPAYYHPEISIFAMEKGKHVISEKPMALSLKAAGEMLKAEEENGVKLAIGLQYRNVGSFIKFKKIIADGVIGHPVMARFSDVRELRPKRAMHDAEFGNGGPMVDMSCHFIDLMTTYFGCEPVKVTAKDFTYAQDRPEIAHIANKAPDTAIMIIEYASGDIGQISLCWGLPPQINGPYTYDALGPKGTVTVTHADGEEKVICNIEGLRGGEVILSGEEAEEARNPELTLVKKFINAVEGKDPVPTGGKQAYIALAASLAALKSSAQGRTVTLEEIYAEQPDVVSCIKG